MQRTQAIVGVAGAVLVLAWPAWAAAAWIGYGHGKRRRGSRLEVYAPTYDVEDTHETLVDAPAPLTYEVATSTGLERSAIVRAIIVARARLLGASAGGPWPAGGIVAQLRAWGWGVLEESPGHVVVLGAVTQPWRPDVRFRALAPDAFADFCEPGFVKIVVEIAVDVVRLAGSSLARVSTRVVTTDRSARAHFRRYWAAFSPGIAVIRRAALRAIRRDAERRWRDASRRASA